MDRHRPVLGTAGPAFSERTRDRSLLAELLILCARIGFNP